MDTKPMGSAPSCSRSTMKPAPELLLDPVTIVHLGMLLYMASFWIGSVTLAPLFPVTSMKLSIPLWHHLQWTMQILPQNVRGQLLIASSYIKRQTKAKCQRNGHAAYSRCPFPSLMDSPRPLDGCSTLNILVK